MRHFYFFGGEVIMIYRVTSDSFTKISEQSGTLQNVDPVCTVEMSNNTTFNNGILVYPHQKHTFSGTDIYLRCADEGNTAEVHVVPFTLDGKGGGSSGNDGVVIDGTAYHVADTDSFEDRLNEYFPD